MDDRLSSSSTVRCTSGDARDGRSWPGLAAAIAIPAALCFAVCLFDIDGRQLWRDEHSAWWAATLPAADFLRLLGHVDAVLAPYYLLLRGWIGIAGDSALALRLPSAAAMSLASALLVLVGRRLYRLEVGVVAGLLFALLPSVSRYGQEARPYAFVVAAVVAATLLLLRALDEPASVRRWIAYAVGVAAVGCFHLVSLLVLVSHAALMLEVGPPSRWRRPREDWGRWAFAVVAGLVLVSPFVVLGSMQSAQIEWIRFTRHGLFDYPSILFRSGSVAAVVLALAAAALRGPRSAVAALVTWAALPPALLLATFDQLHLFYPRYLLFTLPALALLAADTVTRAGARMRPRWLVPAALLAGLLVAGLDAHRALRRSVNPGEKDLRNVAARIAAGFRAGDGIVYGGRRGDPSLVRLGLAYELRGREAPLDVFVSESARELGRFQSRECAQPVVCLPSRLTRLWVVADDAKHEVLDDMPERKAVLLRTRFRVAKQWQAAGTRLLLMTRSDR
jgi:mannosyltransferase